MLILVGLGAIAVAGVAALALGLRGRRTDLNPVCRRCRFDLIALSPGSTRCPECGAMLGSRALRRGNRQRRPRLIILGTVAIITAGVPAAALGYVQSQRFNWATLKPTWLLLREVRSPDEFTSGDAASQLLDRLDERRWNGSGLDTLLDDFLIQRAALRSDFAASPNPYDLPMRNTFRLDRWQHILSTAAMEGLMNEAAAKRFLDEVIEIGCSIRPVVPAGSRQPIFWQAAADRVCGYGNLKRGLGYFGFTCRVLSVSAGGKPLTTTTRDEPSSSPWEESSGSCEVEITLEPGSYAMEVTWGIDIHLPTGNGDSCGTVLRTRSFPLTVVDRSRPSVNLVTDESLREQVEVLARVTDIAVSPHGRVIEARVWLGKGPVPVLGRISLRWPGGRVECDRRVNSWKDPDGNWESDGWFRVELPVPMPKRLDVVITPDQIQAATETVHTTMWGHEVVISDVILKE
jgi:hypothetical protein